MGDKARALEFAPYTTSFFLVGWAVGGLIFGSLGDRYGRARMLTVTLLLYSVCTGLSAFATSFSGFCACLVFTGLGVGGVFGLSVALVADAVPDKTRAPALGLLQSLSSWGNISAGLLGMAIGLLGGPSSFALRPESLAGDVSCRLRAGLSVRLHFGRLREPEKWVRARAEGERKGVKFGSYATLLSTQSGPGTPGSASSCAARASSVFGASAIFIRRSCAPSSTITSPPQPHADALSSKKAYWASLGLLLQNIGGFFGMLSLAKFAQVKGRRPAFAWAPAFVSFHPAGL